VKGSPGKGELYLKKQPSFCFSHTIYQSDFAGFESKSAKSKFCYSFNPARSNNAANARSTCGSFTRRIFFRATSITSHPALIWG